MVSLHIIQYGLKLRHTLEHKLPENIKLDDCQNVIVNIESTKQRLLLLKCQTGHISTSNIIKAPQIQYITLKSLKYNKILRDKLKKKYKNLKILYRGCDICMSDWRDIYE